MDTLTPPPSFRALRVRNRTRATSHAYVAPQDENKCPKCDLLSTTKSLEEPPLSLFEKRYLDAQSRGRSRQRMPRPTLRIDVPPRPRKLSLVIPQSDCCSPLPAPVKPQSPTHEEELMFHMSPVQSESPASIFLKSDNVPSIHTIIATNNSTAEQTSARVLSSLWKSPHGPDRRQIRDGNRKRPRPKGCNRSVKPRRSQLYFDDMWRQLDQQTYTATSEESNMQSLPSPHSPASPEEPFMYNFPIFNSSPLVKARIQRTRRGAAYTSSQPSPNLTSGAPAKTPNLGPIRARNLRIQSGASLFSDDEGDVKREGLVLPSAFRSGSFDDSEKGYSAEFDDEDFVSAAESMSTSSASYSPAPRFDEMAVSRQGSLSRHMDADTSEPCIPVKDLSDEGTSARSRRRPRRSCPPVFSHDTHDRKTVTENEVQAAMLNRGRARYPAQASARFASQGQ